MSNRRLTVVEGTSPFPAYVVWELTLACDQPCTHCGSRAKASRPDELSTERALEVVDELESLGARDIVLIGGEAYLHPGFLRIASAIAQKGMTALVTTGGQGITRERAQAMRDAGIQTVSVSIDGCQQTHDLMRARKGSFASATAALEHLQRAGIQTASNMNLNRFNQADLESVYAHLRNHGIRSWQIQLTAPLGRAADRPKMLLQPYDLLELMPRIAALKEQARLDGILLLPGNNLGYFGPEEALLRSQRPEDMDHFQGCQAGKFVMGIESDGSVKGCPSLQTAHYVGGTLAQASLQTVWKNPKVGFARERSESTLWGYCAECIYRDTCMGGCTFTAHAFFGRPGNQPYCHFRALQMRSRGLRERLVPTDPAPGLPFDNGLFALVEEPFASSEPADGSGFAPDHHLVRITRKPRTG